MIGEAMLSSMGLRLDVAGTIDLAIPDSGPCLVCGHPVAGRWPARHRIIDAIRSRARAGESVADLAADYGIGPRVVALIVGATLRELRSVRRRP